MGIVVLCARLQNLYDWQPFTDHVLRSLLRTHISGLFQFKHNDRGRGEGGVWGFFSTEVDLAFKDIQDLFVFLSAEP